MTSWEKAASELMKESAANAEFSSQTIRIGFKRLSENATIPTKAYASDSGFDLYAAEDVIIEPGETKIVPTDIAVKLPQGFEGQVRPRSGVTAKTKLRVQLGTIDEGFGGNIGVIVDNTKQRMMYVDIGGGTSVLKDVTAFDYFTICGTGEYAGERVADGSYKIRKGDRIAQLVVQALPEVTAVEIDGFTEESERGEGGFGSTGV